MTDIRRSLRVAWALGGFLVFAVVSGTAAGLGVPGTEAPPGPEGSGCACCGVEGQEAPGGLEAFFARWIEGVFGPLPPREVLVTGFDARALAQRFLLSGGASLLATRAGPGGVEYLYERPQERDGLVDRATLTMIAGVFPNTAAASSALARTVASRSLPPPPVKGIGDRAFLSSSNLLLQVNNVLFVLGSLRWVASEQEMGMIAHEVANELDAGTTFVTRGEVVEVPEVVALDLPERVSLGAEVSGRVLRAETQTDYDVAVAEGARKSVPEVERLATSMPAETEEIRRLNDLLWSGQLQPAIEAIHYFAGLRAGPLLALALEHPADYVRGEAASALERLGNRAFAPQLLACLRRSNVTVRGGTEAQIAHSRLVCALLSALGRLTGQDFGPVDAEDFNQVNAVIAKCESWLATHPLSSLPGEVPLAAQPPAAGDVESLFEAKYAAWAAWLQEHASPSSKIDLSTLFDNQPFRDIVALGPPAVPYMVDKMEQNHWIGEALSRITKFKWHERRVGPGPGQWVWIIEEFPELAEETRWPWRGLWRKWCNEGSQKTPQWFDQRYREWQEVLAQGKGLEAQEKYQRIIDLGIGALPYMVEKIQAGDTALVGAVSTLTQGAVGATATPAQCIEWWNANKDKWTLPWGENPGADAASSAALSIQWSPARLAAALVGATVYWDETPGEALFSRHGHLLVVRPGDATATLDGNPLPLEGAPYIEHDRLILPLSALPQAFGVSLAQSHLAQLSYRPAD